MQTATETLKEIEGLYQEIFDQPAPEIKPESFLEFPAGVDPVNHALDECRRLKQLTGELSRAPRPGSWIPPADTFATEDRYFIRIAVLGVPRETLKVFVLHGECIVKGVREQPQQASKMRSVNLELPWGPFERRFTLPRGSKTEEMEARYVDGILELTIPLKEVTVSKRSVIDIK